ncbi:hypothetical protein [Pseudomarimonas salicorniae]|uniref:Anti-sigma-K factor RskA n=1 Tax=Pseudomarimonas salicorniae TaxID=2933270 RepID=A0ABT0GD71_9GAMM|nr:hypothetical protein [Lysobacter sp. CAU 1642]MCK7592496.1 hypothetical protein [Lysobacter sp. CAU 1642]
MSLMPPPVVSEEDNRLLRAWRRGELDEAASSAFEVRLFMEPDLLRAAQADAAFEQAMDEERANPPAVAAKTARRRGQRRAAIGLALAATVAGVAVLPQLLRAPQPVSTGNVEWVSVDVRRGAEEPMLVAPRSRTRLLALEVPAPAQGTLFDVALVPDGGGPPPIHLSQLDADQGVLSLAFERAALEPGVYHIEIRPHGEADAEPVSRLAFRYRP